MRSTTLALMLAVLAAGAVAGCKPKPAAPVRPAMPLVFTQATPDATVKLTIAPAIAAWPDLHKKLYDEGVTELRKDIATAKEDRAHLDGEGLPNPAYEQELAWSVAASNPQLVSLSGTWMSYTGGAHPNSGFRTLIWRINPGDAINRAELVVPPGPGDAAVQTALCDGIRQARAAKGVDPNEDAASWPCPKWRDADFVLAPSTTPGKFGGLRFVFDPYAIGPYAEGPFEVTVPYAAIKGVLAPAYADDFAGAPLQPAPPRTPAKPKG